MKKQLPILLPTTTTYISMTWTNRTIRTIAIAVALAFTLWALIHFGSPALSGHEADGSTWAEH